MGGQWGGRQSTWALSQRQALMWPQRTAVIEQGWPKAFRSEEQFLTAAQSALHCKCCPRTSLPIRLVALPSSARVNLPKILNALVFPADKGAVVKGRLVAVSVFVSFIEFIPDPL